MNPPGRLAIVTGTSAGLGEAVATLLVRRGWDVIGMARRPAAIADPRYRHLKLDLGDLDRLRTTMEREVADSLRDGRWQRIGLVNNAASTGTLGQTERLQAGAMLRSYAVNAVAPIWLMGFVLRTASPTVPIRIVNVSSGAAVHPYPGLGEYAGSKAALRMAGMVLGAELDSPLRQGGPRPDVAILNYAPGVVDTAMQTNARETPVDRFPWAGLFREFLAKGLLVTPATSAAPIAAFLEQDPAERFREGRLGG